MTYNQLQAIIESTCLSYPNVKTFGCGDIYLLNSTTPTYSVMWLSLVSRTDYSNFTTYQVNLFYVDRLKKDISNEEQIISEGMEACETVVSMLKHRDDLLWDPDASVTYTPFRERFSDECAGVYVSFSIQVPVEELCF